MMNVPYVVLKYATLLLSFPINNVVEVVLTTLSAILKSTNNPSHLQALARYPDDIIFFRRRVHAKFRLQRPLKFAKSVW